MRRPEQWPFCFRLNASVNTNMKVESWHYAIKYDEADGRTIKRLDKSLNIVLNAVKTKIIGRIIALEKKKLSSKIKDKNDRHDRSKMLSVENFSQEEEKWIAKSEKFTGMERYDIIFKINCGCEIRWNACENLHSLI